MLKGEISLTFMSDRPLANLILSFPVTSLWKTTTNSFSFDIFMLKIFPARPPHSSTNGQLSPLPTSIHSTSRLRPSPLLVGIYSEPPTVGGSKEGGSDLCGGGLSSVLGPRGHVPIRVKGSPKEEDYLSFVNAALQKPLDINVSWLASVRPGLE